MTLCPSSAAVKTRSSSAPQRQAMLPFASPAVSAAAMSSPTITPSKRRPRGRPPKRQKRAHLGPELAPVTGEIAGNHGSRSDDGWDDVGDHATGGGEEDDQVEESPPQLAVSWPQPGQPTERELRLSPADQPQTFTASAAPFAGFLRDSSPGVRRSSRMFSVEAGRDAGFLGSLASVRSPSCAHCKPVLLSLLFVLLRGVSRNRCRRSQGHGEDHRRCCCQ